MPYFCCAIAYKVLEPVNEAAMPTKENRVLRLILTESANAFATDVFLYADDWYNLDAISANAIIFS
jgi:hypothetical protein